MVSARDIVRSSDGRVAMLHTCSLVLCPTLALSTTLVMFQLTLRPLHLILDPSGASGLASKLLEGFILLDLLRNIDHLDGIALRSSDREGKDWCEGGSETVRQLDRLPKVVIQSPWCFSQRSRHNLSLIHI